MPSRAAQHLEVLVTEPGRLHELLNDAEAVLRELAMCQGSAGILVTRHAPGRFTLALSEAVPFGETRERILQ